MRTKDLYVVEDVNGELLSYNDSDFTVFLTKAEAEDFIEEEDEGDDPKVVRFVRCDRIAELKAENSRLKERAEFAEGQLENFKHGCVLNLEAALTAQDENSRLKQERDEAREALPDDIRDSILSIGEVEWGATESLDVDGHLDHLRKTLKITNEGRGSIDPTPMHGVYVKGTETVVCHTGTSSNSPQHARIITGIWNQLVQVARTQSTPVADGCIPGSRIPWSDTRPINQPQTDPVWETARRCAEIVAVVHGCGIAYHRILRAFGLAESEPVREEREEPRCPECGYTKEDSSMWLDHHLCKGKIPARSQKPSEERE